MRTVVLVLFLDCPHAARGAAAPGHARAREVLRQLAQLFHVVRAQLGQDAGQQLVQLCAAQRAMSAQVLASKHCEC